MNINFAKHPEEAFRDRGFGSGEYTCYAKEPSENHEADMFRSLASFAENDGFSNMRAALPFAWEAHKQQYRRGSKPIPFIWHPMMMCFHAIALGLTEDRLLAAALLHDVCEDCGVRPEELPVEPGTREIVIRLTREPSQQGRTFEGQQGYYSKIGTSREASLIKMLDRCNNISTMAEGFTPVRMEYYIRDTEKWIYPLGQNTAERYPQHSAQIFLIKYQLSSLIETIRRQMAAMAEGKKQEQQR